MEILEGRIKILAMTLEEKITDGFYCFYIHVHIFCDK